MLTRSGFFLPLAGLLCIVCLGCAPALTAIPTGEWTGTGTYVEYEAHLKGKNKTESRSKTAAYATTLSVSERELYGKRALFFDIVSKRGKMMALEGTETHVTFVLVKIETLADGTTLYAQVDLQYNPSSDETVSREQFNEKVQVASAVSFCQPHGIVLQVNYAMPTSDEPMCFWDDYTFEGNALRKVGRVVQVKGEEPKTQDITAIDWVEDLHRTR